jgi:hypothetical protein
MYCDKHGQFISGTGYTNSTKCFHPNIGCKHGSSDHEPLYISSDKK